MFTSDKTYLPEYGFPGGGGEGGSVHDVAERRQPQMAGRKRHALYNTILEYNNGTVQITVL